MLPHDSGAVTGMDYIEQIGDEASINWTTKTVRVKGYGYGPENVKQLGRRKILTKRAAKVDAYRNLVEVIKGVQVTSNTKVEDMMLESDSIQTRTMGMLKGMKVKGVTYSNDGACEITVEVNIDKDGTFLLTALNTGKVKVTDNYQKFDWDAVSKELEKTKEKLARARSKVARLEEDIRKKEALINNNKRESESQSYHASSFTAPGKIRKPDEPVQSMQDSPTSAPQTRETYTGLLVDARELDLKPTLAPSILNQNKEKMYGPGVIPTNVTSGSTADYLPGNIEHARKYKKISDWPLVVKGIEMINESDVMINNEDAQKLFLIRHLLEQGKVVILIKG
jgi:hypothetical protein